MKEDINVADEINEMFNDKLSQVRQRIKDAEIANDDELVARLRRLEEMISDIRGGMQ